MNIKNFFLLMSVGLMAIACQDKKGSEPTPGQDGNEVAFGAVVESSAESRTIYGDKVGNSFPIYWINSDSVIVASPECAENRNQAMYKVDANVPEGTYPTAAGVLRRVSNIGVQWGNEATANFYSIYPQRDNNRVTTTDCENFSINLPTFQTCMIGNNDNPTPYKNIYTNKQVMTTADMYACFMYAKDLGVAKDKTVNLHYTPFSTAIRFRLFTNEVEAGILRVDLIAPEGTNIAGEYTVNLNPESGDYEVAATKGTNEINVVARYKSQAYLQMGKKEYVELNAFLMLESGKTYTIDNTWQIKVTLSNNKVLTKYLGGSKTDAQTTNLTPGKIHYLPDLPDLVPGEWNVQNWMVNIPRNVYLSEISLPGSWNSLNSDFQTTTDGAAATINRQYNLGCRAFHLDTRWNTNTSNRSTWCYPEEVKNTNTLAIANGGSNRDVKRTAAGTDYGKVMYQGVTFASALNSIISNIKDDEYMVVLVTFAQNSYVRNVDFTDDGGIEDKKTWMQGVQDAIQGLIQTEGEDYAKKIFDGSQLSASTTVGDVLGKVIVIVNCEALPSTLTLPTNSKCVYTYMPMLRSAENFPTTGYNMDAIYKPNGQTSGIQFYNTQAQVTSNNSVGFDTKTGNGLSPLGVWFDTDNRGYAPTISQRTKVGDNILTWSKGNLDRTNYSHSDWMFHGLGGYLIEAKKVLGLYTYYENPTNSYTSLTNQLNGWLDGKLTEMQNNKEYYPVGINLLNFVETKRTTSPTFDSPATIKNIVFLNNKFHKAFDPKKEAWPDNTTLQNVTGGNMSDGGNGI